MLLRKIGIVLASLFLFSCTSWAGSLTLNWTDNAVNEDGFKVERQLGNTGAFAEVGQTGPDVATFVDSTPDDQVYCYQVKAFNLAGDSAPSNLACGPTPTAPGGTVITITVTVTITPAP